MQVAEAAEEKSTEQVRAKRVDRKAEGASWSVLDNVRMTGEGTQLVTHKRQFIVFNETLKHTVLRHWLEYMDGNETLVYHFPRSLFELLPLEEPQFHFKSCAVVGNSGVVLLRENGKVSTFTPTLTPRFSSLRFRGETQSWAW